MTRQNSKRPADDGPRGTTRIGSTPVQPYRRWPLLMTVLGMVVFLVTSWAPFELELPVRVPNSLEATDQGLRFTPTSLVMVPEAPEWFADRQDGGYVDIRLRVRSTSSRQSGPARILSLGSDLRNQELVVGQEGTSLVVRTLQTRQGVTSMSRVRVEDVLETDRWRTIDVRLDGQATVIVDGVERTGRSFTEELRRLDRSSQLSLGAEPSGTRAWSGELAVATIDIDGTHRDLLTDAALDVPGVIWQLPDRLDQTGTRGPGSHLWTAGGHMLLSFIIGWGLIASWARPLRPWKVMVVWATIVVIANVVKIGIVARHPSLATGLLQTGSGWLGVVAASWARRSREHAPGKAT